MALPRTFAVSGKQIITPRVPGRAKLYQRER